MDSDEWLPRVKTFDLAFVGWVTVMIVHARVVFSLEALSSGVYFIVQVLLWLRRAEGEVVYCSLLWYYFFGPAILLLFLLLAVCILVMQRPDWILHNCIILI